MMIIDILKMILLIFAIAIIDGAILIWLLAKLETESNEELTEEDKKEIKRIFRGRK